MIFSRSICIAFLFLALAIPADAGIGKKANDRYTIAQLQAPETTGLLLEETRELISEMKADLVAAKAEDDDGDIDDLEDALEIVEYVEDWLSTVQKSETEPKNVFSANGYADRILQTVKQPVEGADLPPLPEAIDNVFVFGIFGQPMRNLPPSKWNKPLGKSAKHEAVNLWSPGRTTFYSTDELAKLTPLEASRLDVAPTNPIWHSRSTIDQLRQTCIEDFETDVVRGMANALREDGVLPNDQSYPIHQARKVVFMEEVYLSATSPKCIVEDAFGVEWKLKWADEVAIEPVSSRLYLLAGAKMTDLTFTNGFGPDDMVLVLMDPEDAKNKKEKDDERYPVTLDDLRAHLDEFYKFDLAPYVHSHGKITHQNVDTIFKNLPDSGQMKYAKSEMIGRTWVSFRESSLELKTKGFVRRHSGSRLSDVLAKNDRAVRGSYLFDMWIANRDVKDDNNKSFFVKSPQKDGRMTVSDYREGHHDLGLSLGSLWSSGEVNKFKTGRAFAKKGLFGKTLRFPQAVVFRPESWDEARWSDSKWMADHLVKISNEQIKDAVAHSNWPDFVQDALVWKLINRRDRIGELYGMPPAVTSAPPSLTIQLETAEQIRAAERAYELPAGSLAAAANGSETVLKDGQIASAKDSAVVRLLVKHRYPSGLNSRYARKGSKPPRGLE